MPHLLRLIFIVIKLVYPSRLKRAYGILYERLVRNGIYALRLDKLVILNNAFRYALNSRLLREIQPVPPTRIRLTPEDTEHKTGKPRIGMIGTFASLLSFPRELLCAYPCEVFDLYIYDVVKDGNSVRGYSSFAEYREIIFDLPADFTEKQFIRAAETIISDRPDALIAVNAKDSLKYTLLMDYLPGIPVISINCGSEFLVHERCAGQSLPQACAEFTVQDGELRTWPDNRKVFGGRFVTNLFFYDPRGLDVKPHEPPGREREKGLIVSFGRLLKLCSPPLLEVVAGLLKKDQSRRFVFFGREIRGEVRRILEYFSDRSLSGQVEYAGHYDVLRDEQGIIGGQGGWREAVGVIRQASLFVNTFPIWGGSSVIEAYLMDVPVAHLYLQGVAWLKNRELLDICVPMLAGTGASAASAGEYALLCERLLSDAAFKTMVLREQRRIAKDYCSPSVFWTKTLNLLSGDHITTFNKEDLFND